MLTKLTGQHDQTGQLLPDHENDIFVTVKHPITKYTIKFCAQCCAKICYGDDKLQSHCNGQHDKVNDGFLKMGQFPPKNEQIYSNFEEFLKNSETPLIMQKNKKNKPGNPKNPRKRQRTEIDPIQLLQDLNQISEYDLEDLGETFDKSDKYEENGHKIQNDQQSNQNDQKNRYTNFDICCTEQTFQNFQNLQRKNNSLRSSLSRANRQIIELKNEIIKQMWIKKKYCNRYNEIYYNVRRKDDKIAQLKNINFKLHEKYERLLDYLRNTTNENKELGDANKELRYRLDYLQKPWTIRRFEQIEAKHKEQFEEMKAEHMKQVTKIEDNCKKQIEGAQNLAIKDLTRQEMAKKDETSYKEQRDLLQGENYKLQEDVADWKDVVFMLHKAKDKMKSAINYHSFRNKHMDPEQNYNSKECCEIDKVVEKYLSIFEKDYVYCANVHRELELQNATDSFKYQGKKRIEKPKYEYLSVQSDQDEYI